MKMTDDDHDDNDMPRAKTTLLAAWSVVIAVSTNGCSGLVSESGTDAGSDSMANSNGSSGGSPGTEAGMSHDADGEASSGACPSGQVACADPYFDSVVLLLHFNGADGSSVVDATGRHAMTAEGAAQISTTTSEFGGASLYLDNPSGSAYLTSPNSPDWDLTSGDSTVEMWVNPTSLPSVNPYLLSQSPVTNDGNWSILVGSDPPYPTNRGLDIQDNGNSGLITTSSVALGSWQHVAVVRSAGSVLLFVNGVLGAQGSTDYYTSSANMLYVGAGNTSSYGSEYNWNGYIDELRITKGVARYTASFTTPSSEFPDAAQGCCAQ